MRATFVFLGLFLLVGSVILFAYVTWNSQAVIYGKSEGIFSPTRDVAELESRISGAPPLVCTAHASSANSEVSSTVLYTSFGTGYYESIARDGTQVDGIIDASGMTFWGVGDAKSVHVSGDTLFTFFVSTDDIHDSACTLWLAPFSHHLTPPPIAG